LKSFFCIYVAAWFVTVAWVITATWVVTATWLAFFRTDFVEELDHLVGVVAVHLMSVTRVVPLNVNASLLKVIGIFLSLTARHDIVCSTVADHVRHVVGVDVSVSAESGMLVGTLLRSASTDHVVLWRHWNRIATAFVSTVDRTRPVAHSVDTTALACELSKFTLDVDRLASYFHHFLSVVTPIMEAK
jgi:hypothetical protein